ncbi:PAS domain-containing protein [Chelativorans intermedius]|uniref:PAS domain-containing protein n=1 Tax=Chelativorans intermedius TaxID=515947 RepID=A0ABV6D6X1_9HYPH|nr:PAS domain-containing protein [Chelativorans intermedius]MCT8999580.1 PAS domain-containing protein [Chelativorans intermedius]
MNQDGPMALFQYWNRLRGSRPAPRRSEIEPADIKNHLPDTFIVEHEPRAEPVFRLAGTRLCAIYGRELKGHALPSLWNARDRPAVGRLLQHAIEAKAVALITFEGLSRDGRVNGFELILLPLEGGSPDGALGLGAVQALMKPYWLGADPIVENRIESFRFIDPLHETPLAERRPALDAPSLSPQSEVLTIRLDDGARRVRHLVVFEGGRRR